ncbi:FadR/GntR family transcriptional regulator [Nocardia sp. BMG51109]|uniref:FadR/GntR family transcriptional regulator n=1 Tax=Nocardia sp. BMG51109 TaxID=1056816 RepID=UPI000463C2E5|nr:FCD domain-containing protein [Nocardia sp. BMG51109]
MAEFHPVRTRSVTTDVINQIADRIRAGELKVGDVLPGERTLATQMDVSRPTVSVAMTRLADAGIITRRPGRNGNSEIVSIWIPDGLIDSPQLDGGELKPDDTFRILEARKTLEPRIAQLAAFRATEQDFTELQESIDLLAANSDNITRAAQAESLFHRIMWRAARNASLQAMMLGLEKELTPIHDMMLRTPEDYTAGIELHTATLAALRRGDPAEIEQEMYRHLGHFESIVADVLRQAPRRQKPDFVVADA